MTELDPTLIPPPFVGKTIDADVLVGHTPVGAVVLRAMIAYPGFLNIRINVHRAPNVGKELWIETLQSTRRTSEGVVPIEVAMAYDDGSEVDVERWSSGANDRALTADYWGVLQAERLPEALSLGWNECFVRRLTIGTDDLRRAIDVPQPLWD